MTEVAECRALARSPAWVRGGPAAAARLRLLGVRRKRVGESVAPPLPPPALRSLLRRMLVSVSAW